MIAYEEIKRINNKINDIERRLGEARRTYGDVSGPASSTDNEIPRFDGTDGKTLQASGALIDDNGNLEINKSGASGEIGVEFYSISSTYSKMAQSDAEGLASYSDLRIGLDESSRTIILCDISDIDSDFDLNAESHPAIKIFNAGASGHLKYSPYGMIADGTYIIIQTTDAGMPVAIASKDYMLYQAGTYYLFGQEAGVPLSTFHYFNIVADQGLEAASEQAVMRLAGTINQGGAANYVGLLMEITEDAIGAGTNELIACRVGGSDKFTIDRTGILGLYGNLNLYTAAQGIHFKGTHGGGDECMTYEDSGGTVRYFLLFPGSDIVQFMNRAANGTVEIHANTSTAGAGGDIKVATFEDDAIKLLESGGILFVGDTANANMTIGLTLNQGAYDDEILAFKSSDVDHGCTDYAETDEFGFIKKGSATQGGIYFPGFTEGNYAFLMRAWTTTFNTTKSTAALGSIIFDAYGISGTGVGNVNANTNIAVFRARRGGSTEAVGLVDEDGEIHLDATVLENQWDDFDDLVLASDYSRILGAKWGELKKYSIRDLQDAGLLTYTPAEQSRSGRNEVFIKIKRGLIFALCTFNQIYEKFLVQEEKINELEKKLRILEA